MFRRYADGEKITEIVASLNARGFRTRGGKPFVSKSFQNALRNTVYIGRYQYGSS